LGAGVAGLGDYNEDDVADFAVFSHAGITGSIKVFSGGSSLSSTPLATVDLSNISLASHVLSAPGDVNGDGTPDFLLSTSQDAVVLFGGATGTVSRNLAALDVAE
jgi:hypothetical protein